MHLKEIIMDHEKLFIENKYIYNPESSFLTR
jgi:hypothetical protein